MEQDEVNFEEEQARIEAEMASLSEDIVMLSNMPGPNYQKPMLDQMLRKLGRLKLRHYTYKFRN